MRQVILTTSEGVELEYTLAGLGSRFLAAFIDTTFQLILILLILLAGGMSASIMGLFSKSSTAWVIAAVVIAIFLVVEGYYVVLETLGNGQTPGKRMAGLRVLRDDGFPLDFRGAMLRNVMRAVDFLPVMYGVGVLCIFFNDQHRRLGDMVAGTIVVRERDEDTRGTIETGFTWRATASDKVVMTDSGVPLPLELLTPVHVELVETFLRRRNQLSPDVRSSMATDVASRMRMQMRLPPQAISIPNEQLLEDIVRGMARRAGL